MTDNTVVYLVEGDEGIGAVYAADTVERARKWANEHRETFGVAMAVTAIEVDHG